MSEALAEALSRFGHGIDKKHDRLAKIKSSHQKSPFRGKELSSPSKKRLIKTGCHCERSRFDEHLWTVMLVREW